VIAAMLLAAAGAATPVAEREPGTHIAFVGELVWIREMNPCVPGTPLRDGETALQAAEAANARLKPKAGATAREQAAALAARCFPFNHAFRARYRVLESMAGIPPAAEVEFDIADHYGTPSFTRQPHALLVVTIDGAEAYLQKYQGIDVDPLESGGWAMCGSLRDHPDAKAPASEPLAFVGEDSAFDVSEFKAADLEKLRNDPDFEVAGTTAHCRRGVPAAKALRFLQDGVLKARGVVLEPAPAPAVR
jgi:hypothetical protein